MNNTITGVSFSGSMGRHARRFYRGERPVSATLKRGMISGDNELFDWFNTIGIGTVERRDIIVSLLDESHSPTMVWKLRDAWPAQMSATDLKASANEIAIESLVLVCEGVTRESP